MSRLTWSFVAPLLCLAPVAAAADEIAPAGRQLSKFLDGLHVERLWTAGHAVDWQTGERLTSSERLNAEERGASTATHSSAFVAAAAERLGIYILRPPQHAEHRLANAQCRWLHGEKAREQGWRAVKSAEEAQRLANHGQLVVAAFENPDQRHAGHVAIVRPAIHGAQHLHDVGPQIIQAGPHNYNSTSLAHGFKHHPLAWGNRYVRFYAHAVEWKP